MKAVLLCKRIIGWPLSIMVYVLYLLVTLVLALVLLVIIVPMGRARDGVAGNVEVEEREAPVSPRSQFAH